MSARPEREDSDQQHRRQGRQTRGGADAHEGGGGHDTLGGLEAGEVRRRLAEERERLTALVEENRSTGPEGAEELSSLDQHPAEIATETFDNEQSLSLREQLEAELAEIDEAERRLEDGRYGRCEACGRPIGAERLRALPATRWCIEDERRAEREAAGRAGPAVSAPTGLPPRG